ncbi:MAG: divalent-cation tolerance protein CutA [Hyphomonadaceae bacterium]|nr:divalent-cation tolerance protein CutA [Hyphomonadaceae bacterium]
MEAVLIYSTWPDDVQARACAETLINEHAAACATLLPSALSVYRWQGAVEASRECVMLAKTTAARAEAARDLILKVHPYELPCVTVLRIDSDLSHANFLAWLARETT